MKLKHFFPLVLILVVNIQLLFGQNQSRVYDFPIKPGTKEWKSLSSYEDRLNAYNIPANLLENMNTPDLVKTCLNYPEFRLIMTRNSLQQGYDYLKSIFNGFRELEKRIYAGVELLKEFKKLNPSDIKNFDTQVKQGEFAFRFTYIEILLAQKPILTTMDNESKKELVITFIPNFEATEKMSDYYGIFGLRTSALVLARLLDVNHYQDFIMTKSKNNNLRVFVDYTIMGDANILSDIISFSKAYLIQIDNE
jgi:hypothetical protein